MIHRVHNSKGFTLIQLLVVIFIIGVVIGLLLPALLRVGGPSARVRCANHLRQLVLATHNFASNNGGKLPDCMSPINANTHIQLLPYVEYDALYQAGTRNGTVDWNTGYDDATASGTPVRSIGIKPFLCSADPGITSTGLAVNNQSWAGTSFASNMRVFGQVVPASWRCNYTVPDIPDGASNTIFFVEKGGSCNNVLPRP